MNKILKILIATYPFAVINKEPVLMLERNGAEIVNPCAIKKAKLNNEELKKYIADVDAVIAGTEKYDKEILSKAKKLKVISRVGIGLDNIDFKETAKRKIAVFNTPDAPSRAVAELTVGFIICCARKILIVDNHIRKNKWNRIVGKDIYKKNIGIIGLGRIGKLVAKFLQPFEVNIFVNDIKPDENFIKKYSLNLVDKKTIYKKSDIITLHVPSTRYTKNMINKKTLSLMKKDACLINTARGTIVNEKDMVLYLKTNPDFIAAFDVFEQEPYTGILTKLDNVILTPHLGSCSENSRYLMETGAVRNILQFFRKINESK